ncbi:uncharacterized protein LOC122266758, partial [Penaeus japonicus]|uniref:uncharacterized protein LOC122266758 n=1 Tax=Penaeus japonicus TaxID=27405 RepID=UPI001C70FAD4
SQGPRAKYLRRQWEAEAEANLEDVPPEVEVSYSTTSKADYSHPRPYTQQEEPPPPPPGPSSPLDAAPITFWTFHRAKIPGTTTPAAGTNVFPRSATFSTPIMLALDPPTWPGWNTC